MIDVEVDSSSLYIHVSTQARSTGENGETGQNADQAKRRADGKENKSPETKRSRKRES